MDNSLIKRQDAIEAVKKNTFRLTFAEEQNCEGHVAWSANAVYSDVIEGALLELPPTQPTQKKGKWVKEDWFFNSMHCKFTCLNCGYHSRSAYKYCPNCGSYM